MRSSSRTSSNAARPATEIRSPTRSKPIDPATGARNALAFAMYHPAFALYQASNKQTLVDDIRLLPAALIDSRKRREAAIEPAPAPIPEPAPSLTAEAEPSATVTPETDPDPETPDPGSPSAPTPAIDDATPQLTLF